MAKAASPVRLQNELMEEATAVGAVQHRSAAEQIEYWADLGRKVTRMVDPEVLLNVGAGLARLTVEAVQSPAIDPEIVFAKLDRDRESGALAAAISARSPVRYQSSATHPGKLEQLDANGQVLVGEFINGEFVALARK